MCGEHPWPPKGDVMSRPWCFLEMDTVDLSEDRRVIGVTYTLPEQRDQMAVRSCLAIPPTADEVS